MIMDGRTILQIPLSSTLKSTATQVAEDMGFSSLQEVVRVLLTKLASKQITISIQETVKLSPKAEKRYQRMTHAFKKKTRVFSAGSVDALMEQLHGHSLS